MRRLVQICFFVAAWAVALQACSDGTDELETCYRWTDSCSECPDGLLCRACQDYMTCENECYYACDSDADCEDTCVDTDNGSSFPKCERGICTLD